MGLHLTYWPLGLAYGEEWGLDFLILHEEFFYDLHSYLPEGPWLDKVGDWIPPTPWRLLAPSYHPSLAQIEKFNHYLSRLQSLRKKIGHIPSQSTIFRTVTTKGETYIHFSQKALESY
ncbi:MAG: hypothetical protein RMJ66_03245 [Bacteroidia bacterium]|nr:hypothetical protein [Bacteroidia bacterium]